MNGLFVEGQRSFDFFTKHDTADRGVTSGLSGQFHQPSSAVYSHMDGQAGSAPIVEASCPIQRCIYGPVATGEHLAMAAHEWKSILRPNPHCRNWFDQ